MVFGKTVIVMIFLLTEITSIDFLTETISKEAV